MAIAGGIISTTVIERQRQRRDSLHLALAFRGEIIALLEQVRERRYQERFAEIVSQIEGSGEPFFAPFRVRFAYDRVYEANVARLGLLEAPLPERIPIFYNRLTSVLEDLVSLGDGTYNSLDTKIILRIYRDCLRLLELTLEQGEDIVAIIDREYATRSK